MIYSAWLFGFSLLFVAIERLWPRRRQALFRRGIASDIAYLIFNSEYLGLFIGLISIRTIAALDRGLDLAHLRQGFYMGAMGGQRVWFSVPRASRNFRPFAVAHSQRTSSSTSPLEIP